MTKLFVDRKFVRPLDYLLARSWEDIMTAFLLYDIDEVSINGQETVWIPRLMKMRDRGEVSFKSLKIHYRK